MQLLLHEPTHLQHLIANFFQVFVEAAGNVVGEVGRFHKNYLRAQTMRTLATAARTPHGSSRAFIYIRLEPASTHGDENGDSRSLSEYSTWPRNTQTGSSRRSPPRRARAAAKS